MIDPRSVLRLVVLTGLTIAGGCAVHDSVVGVPRQFSTRAVAAAIRTYRATLSPRVGRFVTCRFRPSCSAYGLASVERYGALRGGWKTAVRIARCNPATPMGTIDPP